MTENSLEKSRSALGILVKIIVAAGILWFLQDLLFPSGTWRYRMTVTVETPEGTKTGSVVREVRVQKGIALLPEMSPSVEVEGEAAVIDLGKRGLLFMLVTGDYGYRVLFTAFPIEGPLTSKGIRYYNRLKNAKATLTPEQYPNFARFRDINDPKTIENVRLPVDFDIFRKEYPRRPLISPQDAFGSGVDIKSVTIEMTEDPVTHGVSKYLPWLESLDGKTTIGGNRTSGPEWYDTLYKSAFKRNHF